MLESLLDILGRELGTIEDRIFATFVSSALQNEYAAQGVKHAIDITEEEARIFLTLIHAVDVRTAMWLMQTVGARNKDLKRLQSWQYSFLDDQQRIEIQFMVTKTIGDVTQKRHVSFPFVIPPDEGVRKFLLNKEQLPKTQRCNEVLRKALEHVKCVSGRTPTTYSFRRLFEHRIIRWYTRDDGTVEWMKVLQWSGHKDETVLKGSYSQVQKLEVPGSNQYGSEQQKKDSERKRGIESDAKKPKGLSSTLDRWIVTQKT